MDLSAIPPKTVAKFVIEATTIEMALKRRPKQYGGNLVGPPNASYVVSMRIP